MRAYVLDAAPYEATNVERILEDRFHATGATATAERALVSCWDKVFVQDAVGDRRQG